MIKGAPLENGSRDQAGSARPDSCPQCKHDVPPGSRFCNQCGSPLPPPKPAANGAAKPHSSPAPVQPAPAGPSLPVKEQPGKMTAASQKTAVRPQHPAVQELHQNRLQRCLEEIQRDKDIPAFSHSIAEVMGCAGNDEASLQHLTNIILRDYSLTLSVLRLANSAYYNRSGKSICSVARAVTMMGIDAVKRLSSGMMLLDNYAKRSPGVRELLLLSLLTAGHSYQAAQKLKMKDADQVYMCGMFRNLGEIVIALFKSESYERVLKEMQERNLTAHDASLKVLEFTFEDLGRAVASLWKLPAAVASVMASSNPANFSRQNDDEKIKTLVSFSHDLTHVVYRRSPEDRKQALDNLADKYGSIPNMDMKSIQQVLNDAVTKTKDTFSTVGVPLNDLHLRRQYEAVLTGADERRVEENAALAAVTDNAEEVAAMTAKTQPAANEDLLAQLVTEIHASVEPGSEPRLNEVLMMVLEAFHRGAGFARVVFCLATRDRTSVRGRIGLGAGIEAIAACLQIPLYGQTESLTLPLMSKKDLFIDAENDDRYKDSALIDRLSPSCFGILPIVVDGVAIGCLYFDKLVPNAVPSQQTLATLAGLRNILAELIRRTRSHTF